MSGWFDVDPLFETNLWTKKICFVCGSAYASTCLYSTYQGKMIVPFCSGCSSEFNFYGYAILERIRPGQLRNNLIKFKLMHPFSNPSLLEIYRDSQAFLAWGKKMRKYLNNS